MSDQNKDPGTYDGAVNKAQNDANYGNSPANTSNWSYDSRNAYDAAYKSQKKD